MAKRIPALIPSQFDAYFFENWKLEASGFFDNFHIERIENYKNHLKLPIEPHRRSVYYFFYITKGLTVRSKGLTDYKVKPNNFFCMPADQITSLKYITENITGYYCHFKADIFNQSILKINLNKDFNFFKLTGKPLIEIKQSKRIIQLLKILEEEYQSNNPKRLEIIPLYLISLLKELQLQNPELQNKKPNAANLITEKYKGALSENIHQLRTVAAYADLLSISANHLHKSVKQVTGKTAHKLLDEMRILESKVLLKQTNLSIADIAFRVGKCDPSDFSRFFKKYTEMSPKKYRLL